MSLITLPDDLLTLIIVEFDRYSLSSIILSCRIIYNRSRDPELVKMLISNKNGSVPVSPLLIAYDYCLVKPQKFIPVIIRGNNKYYLFVDCTIVHHFTRLEILSFIILIVVNEQLKYVE
jgi:hypothetical protein